MPERRAGCGKLGKRVTYSYESVVSPWRIQDPGYARAATHIRPEQPKIQFCTLNRDSSRGTNMYFTTRVLVCLKFFKTKLWGAADARVCGTTQQSLHAPGGEPIAITNRGEN